MNDNLLTDRLQPRAKLAELLCPETDAERDAVAWLSLILGTGTSDHNPAVLRLLIRAIDQAYDRGAADEAAGR